VATVIGGAGCADIVFSQALAVARRNAPALGTRRAEAALEDALLGFYTRWATATGGTVRRQASLKTPSWPGVGRVDLEVVEPHAGRRAWMELKWASLHNCAWDLPKMALALAEGHCDRALLVVAVANDEADQPGGEFLTPGTWDTGQDILLAHRKWWLYWKNEVKTRPLRLPASIATVDATPGIPVNAGWISVGEDRLPSRD
jgi:hypothetical protein